jgi:transcriptional regulator GlxA family with amidase domain
MKRDAISSVEPACDSALSGLEYFGFLTLPNFAMIAFTSALEVLRMPNYVGRAQHYTWSVTYDSRNGTCSACSRCS